MKATKAQIDWIVREFQKVIEIRTIDYHYFQIKNDARIKDIDKRIRWDYFWAAINIQRKAGIPITLHRELKNLNDTHIDTALKAAFEILGYKSDHFKTIS